MKNKIFLIVLSIILLLPFSTMAGVRAELNSEVGNEINSINTEITEENPISSIDEELEKDVIQQPSTYKTPISKRKIAKKFALAMLGVGISSFLIFFMLTLYNRVREKIVNEVKTPEGETTLKAPDDLNEAVKTFLDKTNWNV